MIELKTIVSEYNYQYLRPIGEAFYIRIGGDVYQVVMDCREVSVSDGPAQTYTCSVTRNQPWPNEIIVQDDFGAELLLGISNARNERITELQEISDMSLFGW